MKRTWLAVTTAIGGMALIVGCGLLDQRWEESTVEGRRFSHPVTWQVQLPKGDVFGGLPHFRQHFYVGNVTIGPECVAERTNEFHCGVAIPPLDDGDIVISWGEVIGMGAGLGREEESLVIDGHEARLQVSEDPGSQCEGADVAASVDIKTTDHSKELILFCSRGVSQQEALAAFGRFASSIDIERVGTG